ncbi:ATP-binding protein, partial [Streptomyces sp. WELS2]|uniref:ATP-binding protein n=1 Tax=Streptomyces sp. WELS2 TaxID=2749435 RepID=UPI00286823D8
MGRGTMHIFGRSRELQSLAEAFTDSARGNGRLVIITGGPGSGKTQLMHEFLTTLHSADARVLAGTASTAERTQPMSLVGQLLGTAEAENALSHPGPPAVSPPAHDRHPRAPWPHTLPATTAPRAAEALLHLVPGEGPLVIALDDAHAMDPDSLTTVVHLLRRSRCRRVLVVCATSGHLGALHSAAHTELLRQPHRRVRLAPLSEASVGELLAAQAGRVLPGSVCDAYHQATAGNPLLVHALLDDSA